MVKLLIIADDFTGALDTAVQFASCGTKTRVITDTNYNLNHIDQETEVLVINAETRHLGSEVAHDIVYDIVKSAVSIGVPHIFKKTDSGLRGNIGSELSAVVDAAGGGTLHFIPALPKMNRTTENGLQFIDGVPVNLSVFGNDPFDPVSESDISKMIMLQSDILVKNISLSEKSVLEDIAGIAVYDAITEQDIENRAKELYRHSNLKFMAGCAGFAAMLPRLLDLKDIKPVVERHHDKFLVVCGSVNPITKQQLDYAEEHGFKRLTLIPEQKLYEAYYHSEEGHQTVQSIKSAISESRCTILDSNDPVDNNATLLMASQENIELEELRTRISMTMGLILKQLLEEGLDSTIMITGGDTLLGFMKQIGACELTPLYELAPGTVLSQLTHKERIYDIISKSGGFGERELLINIANNLFV